RRAADTARATGCSRAPAPTPSALSPAPSTSAFTIPLALLPWPPVVAAPMYARMGTIIPVASSRRPERPACGPRNQPGHFAGDGRGVEPLEPRSSSIVSVQFPAITFSHEKCIAGDTEKMCLRKFVELGCGFGADLARLQLAGVSVAQRSS